MELTHQLAPMLRTLRLSGILETLDVRNRQAVEQQSSFVDFLTMLLHDEVERRAQSKLRLRLRRAAFDPTKTLEGFDFSFNPKLNKAQVFDLATGQFIERHESVLVYGPTGVGKSHLAQALAHEACRRGYEVLFVATDKMLTHLAGGRADGTREARLARYTRPAADAGARLGTPRDADRAGVSPPTPCAQSGHYRSAATSQSHSARVTAVSDGAGRERLEATDPGATGRAARPAPCRRNLVLHCGESTEGFHLSSLVAVDVASGWIELGPIWGVGALRFGTGGQHIHQRLPVRLREWHTDDGSEFLDRGVLDASAPPTPPARGAGSGQSTCTPSCD